MFPYFTSKKLYLGREGTNSCLQINFLRWRCKQLLSEEAILTLQAQTVAF